MTLPVSLIFQVLNRNDPAAFAVIINLWRRRHADIGGVSAPRKRELAKEANDIFARTALVERAEEFNHAADQAEGPRGGRLPKAS